VCECVCVCVCVYEPSEEVLGGDSQLYMGVRWELVGNKIFFIFNIFME
jgi:hypothetical protein